MKNRKLLNWICAAFALAGLYFLCLHAYSYKLEKDKETEVKLNVHEIQLGIEKYAMDRPDGQFPVTMDQVLESGYLNAYPENPFTTDLMLPIAVGSEPSEGNFTYEPVFIDGKAKSYQIYAYGSFRIEERSLRPDVKHVIIILGPMDHHTPAIP